MRPHCGLVENSPETLVPLELRFNGGGQRPLADVQAPYVGKTCAETCRGDVCKATVI